MFYDEMVGAEHLHWAFLWRIFGENTFQIRRDIFANPLLLEHGSRLHHIDGSIWFDEKVRHRLTQGLADNESFTARFAQREVASERKLFASGAEDRSMDHEGVLGKLAWRRSVGFARSAAGNEQAAKYRKNCRQPPAAGTHHS